jgi:hypothetical protein
MIRRRFASLSGDEATAWGKPTTRRRTLIEAYRGPMA